MKLNGKEIFVHDIENMGKEDLRQLIYELAESRADLTRVLEKRIKEKIENYQRVHELRKKRELETLQVSKEVKQALDEFKGSDDDKIRFLLNFYSQNFQLDI